MHYGIRCAHLHLRHHLDTLPGLAAPCKASAEALSTAYQDVESGRLQDHPNQEALRRTLTTVSALQPVIQNVLGPLLTSSLFIQLVAPMESLHALFAPEYACPARFVSLHHSIACAGVQGAAVGRSQSLLHYVPSNHRCRSARVPARS